MNRGNRTTVEPVLDRAVVITGLREAQERQREAEIDQLCLIAQAADAYSWIEETGTAEEVGLLHGERLWRFGADGTPEVAEFITHEVGPALGVAPERAAALIGDVLNLRHRHPALWDLTVQGYVKPWVSRKVARLVAERGLALASAQEVDRLLAPIAPCSSPRRLFNQAERLCDVVDPDQAQRQRQEALADRFVEVRPAGGGTVALFGQLDGAAGLKLDQTLSRLAGVLAAGEPTAERRLLRARAMELLAEPEQAAQVLAGRDGSAKAPSVQLVVHVTGDDVRRDAGGEVVGLGSVVSEQLEQMLSGATVCVRPVVDLAKPRLAEGYVPSASIRREVLLRQPMVAFPYASRSSWGGDVDLDHVVPWPLGKTTTDNLIPLDRRTHRAKTHSGFRVERIRSGLWRWRTPLGQEYYVSPHGTYPVEPGSDLVLNPVATLRRERRALKAASLVQSQELGAAAERAAKQVFDFLNPALIAA